MQASSYYACSRKAGKVLNTMGNYYKGLNYK